MMKCNAPAKLQERQLNEFSEREKSVRVEQSALSLTELTPHLGDGEMNGYNGRRGMEWKSVCDKRRDPSRTDATRR
jgi:hypothetical protein